MTSRGKTALRASVFAAVCALAVALFVRPFSGQKPRRFAAAQEAVPAEPPGFREHVTPEGLVAVDSRALLARIHRSRARAVIVGAWATWCGSCKVDIPILIGLRKTLGADVDVLLVSVDEPEAHAQARKMLTDFGETETTYVVEEELSAFKPAMHPLWPGMLPATFLFDPSPKVHYFWGGPAAESEIVPLVKRYLAGENVDGHSDFALIRGQGPPPGGH